MIRNNYGEIQIHLPAMKGSEFKYLIESLDFARYEGAEDHD